MFPLFRIKKKVHDKKRLYQIAPNLTVYDILLISIFYGWIFNTTVKNCPIYTQKNLYHNFVQCGMTNLDNLTDHILIVSFSKQKKKCTGSNFFTKQPLKQPNQPCPLFRFKKKRRRKHRTKKIYTKQALT